MKKHTIFCLFIIAVLFGSCNGSDLDYKFEDDHNKIEDPNLIAQKDTVGVDYFSGNKYLLLSRKENRVLYYLKQSNLLEIKPVLLPEGDNTATEYFTDDLIKTFTPIENDNRWIGNPFALYLGNNKLLMTVERRVDERANNSYSDNMFVTFQGSNIVKTENFAKYAPYGNPLVNPNGLVPMMATDGAGTILTLGKGLLASKNNGSSWTHYPEIFNDLNALNNPPLVGVGANISYIPSMGFILASNQLRIPADPALKPGQPSRILKITPEGDASIYLNNWIPRYRRSERVWSEVNTLTNIIFYDPVKLGYNGAPQGAIVGFGQDKTNVYTIVILPDSNGDIELPNMNDYANTSLDEDVYEFDYKSNIYLFATEIITSSSRASGINMIYNSTNGRFEIMQSSPYGIYLWSMPAADLFVPENGWDYHKFYRMPWVKDCDMLVRSATFRSYGCHPVTSYVNEDTNTIHTFLDAGNEYPARSGIFELIRTTNTKRMVDSLEKRRKIANGQPF